MQTASPAITNSSARRAVPENPLTAAPGHLQVVVVEADRAEAERDEQHRPRHRGWSDWPTAASTPRSPARIISPPMVGVPCFLDMWLAGPSSRIGWPLPCLKRRWMITGPEQEHEQRRHDRAAGAERDVAKHIEDRKSGRSIRRAGNRTCVTVPLPDAAQKLVPALPADIA